MAVVRNCEIPEDLYYSVSTHVWARPLGDGRVRIGLTAAGYAILRNAVVAVDYSTTPIGQAVAAGRSVALVESMKYIGPVPAPFAGVVLCGNPQVEAQPELAMNDPYGEGWIAEMRPDDWEAAAATLPTGEAAVRAYRALLEMQAVSCD
jgi:glycine cleavage system H protein